MIQASGVAARTQKLRVSRNVLSVPSFPSAMHVSLREGASGTSVYAISWIMSHRQPCFFFKTN